MTTLAQSASKSPSQTRDRLLRVALEVDSGVSGLAGLGFLLFSSPIAAFLGVSPEAAGVIAAVGVGFLVWAAALMYTATRPQMNRGVVWSIIAGNAIYVLGSLLILIADPFAFSTEGRWATLIIADVVLLFGIGQYIGLRRLNK